MKRHLTAPVALALLAFAAPGYTANGNIGIYGDDFLATCNTMVDPNGQTTLHIYALLQGGSTGGITGLEYAISETNDGGFLFLEAFEPASAVVGVSAFGVAGGLNISYASCNSGAFSKIKVGTVLAIDNNTQPGQLNVLTVVKRVVPSNPFFQCPLFVLCDSPVFTKMCIGSNVNHAFRCPFPPANNFICNNSTSGQFFLNQPWGPNECTVAVEQTTWTEVKNLYSK